jgi:hypothetical protein
MKTCPRNYCVAEEVNMNLGEKKIKKGIGISNNLGNKCEGIYTRPTCQNKLWDVQPPI